MRAGRGSVCCFPHHRHQGDSQDERAAHYQRVFFAGDAEEGDGEASELAYRDLGRRFGDSERHEETEDQRGDLRLLSVPL